MRQVVLCLLICAVMLASAKSWAQDKQKASRTDWRSGWVGIKDEAECRVLLKAAKDLKFHALVANGSVDTIRMFSALAAKEKIESYFWLAPAAPEGKQRALYVQKLRPEEEKAYQALNADTKKMEHGYQGGGEPLPGHVEFNWNPAPCLHHPEVMAATKEKIAKYIKACPQLTGIGLDMFGYHNYRDCVCEASQRAYARWRKENPSGKEEDAWNRFFFASLVAGQNELLDYARSLRPGIKTTVHVWPVYLPKPLYGNHLNLDYCAQTAAWFFLPYWSDAKIASYSKTIVNDAKQYHARQTGVPFVGLFVGQGAGGDKPVERFIHEVSVIFESTPSRSLSIFRFNDLVQNPEYQKKLKALFAKYGIK